jgi:hypothetical protein
MRAAATAIPVCLALLSGCSSMGVFFNRPVVEDTIQDEATTVSLAADRRTVIFLKGGAKMKFCAEPPPDVASSITASFAATLKHKDKAEVAVKDAFGTDLLKLSERTADLDALRVGLFKLCNLYLAGGIKEEKVGDYFELLVKGYFSRPQATGTSTKKGEEPRGKDKSEGTADDAGANAGANAGKASSSIGTSDGAKPKASEGKANPS